jgi:hypothetical protein
MFFLLAPAQETLRHHRCGSGVAMYSIGTIGDRPLFVVVRPGFGVAPVLWDKDQ